MAVTAGIVALREISQPGVFDSIVKTCDTLVAGIRERAKAADIPMVVNHAG
ncbi:unnamed protein product, partial [marine sediment metagenome]